MPLDILLTMIRQDFLNSVFRFCQHSYTQAEVDTFSHSIVSNLYKMSTDLGFTPIKSMEELQADLTAAISSRITILEEST